MVLTGKQFKSLTIDDVESIRRKAIGAAVRKYRRRNKINMADIVGRLGISESTLSRFERGINIPTWKNLNKRIPLSLAAIVTDRKLEDGHA